MNLKAKIANFIRGMTDAELCSLIEPMLIAVYTEDQAPPAEAPAPVKPKRARRPRLTDEEKSLLVKNVQQLFSTGRAFSVGEVATVAEAPKSVVASLLRTLVSEGSLCKYGDRRFCRYAKDKDVAKTASEEAKSNTPAALKATAAALRAVK